jgi:adenosylmethionine-8-amino-7-oxononanoate aminotransferase
MNLKRRERAFLAGASELEDLQVRKTDGSFLYDGRGRKYVDFIMGWCVGNVGWGSRQIRSRLQRFRGPDYVYPEFGYAAWAELAELLARIAPGRLKKSFRATGGSEAVDIALQVAMAQTRRKRFLAIEGSYHGNTVGAVSVAATDSREPYPNLLAGCLTIEPPLDARAADRVETKLKSRKFAAVILEPIICNLGVLTPEPEFMSRLRALCTKYGTLLIFDEVATGFGRTGKMFASEHFDLAPDILCVAKAITGGYAPMGATLVTDEIADAVEGKVGFWSTYGWHPLAVEAGIANLRWMLRHRASLFAHIQSTSGYFGQRLDRIRFRRKATVRRQGLAIGIELASASEAEKIHSRCRKNGLLVALSDDTLMLFPALNVPRNIAARGLDILEASV